jgi:hypothetical protein
MVVALTSITYISSARWHTFIFLRNQLTSTRSCHELSKAFSLDIVALAIVFLTLKHAALLLQTIALFTKA